MTFQEHLVPLTEALEEDMAIEALTYREGQILRGALAGIPDGQIGHHLNLARSTVRWHMRRILRKFLSPSRVDMIGMAFVVRGSVCEDAQSLALYAKQRGHHLTHRQQEVLPLLLIGDLNERIGAEFNMGIRTTKTHVKGIFRRLAVTRRDQFLALVLEVAAKKTQPSETSTAHDTSCN